ncbi:MAG: ORF6N domain-containing protein [Bacteroidetes bacterium]|nr:ORF6N domain-containing protein [Bacteroidota bacterium]
MELQLQEIQNKIYEIRGRRVMLDFDLAEMYGVETAQLKRAVRRNIERFEGEDFMFTVTKDELSRCQIGILNTGRGGNIKYLPFAFGELGVAMLSSVLNSSAAIEVNRRILRAFVAVREYLLTHASQSIEISHLRERVLLLERATDDNTGAINENIEAINDLSEDIGKELETIYDAIGALSVKIPQLKKNRRPIGFKPNDE